MQKIEKEVVLIFPHQLTMETALFEARRTIYMVEEWLFFHQYAFHKQKIAFHRASMKAFAHRLEKQGHTVNYIEATEELCDIRLLMAHLNEAKITHLKLLDPADDWMRKRLWQHRENIQIEELAHPIFLLEREQLREFFQPEETSFFQASFYKWQRERLDILIDENGQPEGGKWSFDADNQKKYPKRKTPPPIQYPDSDDFWKEAVTYVKTHFADNPGELSNSPLYPYTEEASRDWLNHFLNYRFAEFGDYEDAIVQHESILHHSVLTPMLNVGLLLPADVIDATLTYAQQNGIPLNSTEGFVRQIIGWREFIRGVYEHSGTVSRTRNFWQFDRKIPRSFYDGRTGVLPIDETIKKVLKTGYCHHIERLMVLGNFMLLCEFDPDEVYRWFMELFVDAYDWVMVPNVYGMSQFADGGVFATKPYIGGSNYIRKMSDYPKGDWEAIWDGLFWRFIHEHKGFFAGNYRSAMMVRNLERMSEEKRAGHLKAAEQFMQTLGE